MSDYSKLKELAEACGDLNWRAIQENWCEWAIRDDHAYIATMRTKSAKQPGPCSEREAKAKFLCAMTPAAVLALIAENEALRAKLENPDPILIQCLDAAIAEQEQLEKDAKRYRWFRKQHWDSSVICAVVDPKLTTRLGAYCPSLKLLDDAIDAGLAMSKESGQ